MKPILVTGAAKGLGAEICHHLASKGHDIVVHYHRSEEEAHHVVERCRKVGVEADFIRGDFTTSAAVENFIAEYKKKFSPTKGIVNNVGNLLVASALEFEGTQDLFQTNLFAPLQLISALIPSIQEERGGIVNIGVSGVNSFRPWMRAVAYGATKSSLLFYTLSLAKQLAPDNVNVNMVSPGYLETSVDIIDEKKIPMKRAGRIDEVARVVAFLFEEENHYITGQNIEVAGGFGL